MFRAVPGGQAQPAARIRRSEVPIEVPSGSWVLMDQVDLEEEFLRRTPMLKSCPHFLRGRFRHCVSVTLQERCRAKLVGDTLGEERAWKAFGLVPHMLLHKPKGAGNVGKQELMERANKFAREDWLELMQDRQTSIQSSAKEHSQEEEQRRRGQAACNRVKHGQVSRARQEVGRRNTGSKNSGNIGRVTRATSSRTGPRDPTRGVGESPQARGFGFVLVCEVSGQCSIWKCPRTWGVHLRDVESVLGRCRDPPSSVPCCRRFGKSRGTGAHHQSIHVSHDDSAVEARWRSARDCNWNVFPQIGGKDDGPTILPFPLGRELTAWVTLSEP